MYLVPRVIRVIRLDPLPPSRLGFSFSCCAPAAIYPKDYAKHCAARAVACRRYHVGSLQELSHTICDPVVPLLVALCPTLAYGDGYPIPPHSRGAFPWTTSTRNVWIYYSRTPINTSKIKGVLAGLLHTTNADGQMLALVWFPPQRAKVGGGTG